MFAGLMTNPTQAQYRFGVSTIMPYVSGEAREPISEKNLDIENTDISGYGLGLTFPAGWILRLDRISTSNSLKIRRPDGNSLDSTSLDVDDALIISAGYRWDDYPHHLSFALGTGRATVELGQLFLEQQVTETAELFYAEWGFALRPNFDLYLGLSLIDIGGELPFLDGNNYSNVNYDIGGRAFSIGINFAWHPTVDKI